MPIDLPLHPSYPAARQVAGLLQVEFAPPPTPATMERIIDATFWASLRREEGRTPTVSLGWLPPDPDAHPILFERPLPLTPEALTRLGPAVERPGIHLGIWHEGSQLQIWGATRTLPAGCFVLEVVAPGLLVIKQPGDEESAKYVNVAVLEGDQVKVLSNAASVPDDSPPIVRTLLHRDAKPSLLVELAVSMRKHGRGGSLLVVPSAEGPWRESIVEPMAYRVTPAYADEDLHRRVETVAGFTAVDGATVITESGELLAFGAKIARRERRPRVELVAASELIEGGTVQQVHPAQLGGTRHLSAAQFVQDQRDAVALVASQDGRFTVFAWSTSLSLVHAYRVETFLV